MNKRKIKIDEILKSEFPQLGNQGFIEVEDLDYEIIEAYKNYIKRQSMIIDELKLYKERELDAFAIGDAISDGICLIDKNGIVIAVNKGYTDITGISEVEIVGQHIQVMLDKGYFTRAVTLMVLKQKNKVSTLSTIARTNKKVLITGNPFFNEKGEITQVLTVMRDLTELINTKEKLEKVGKESEKYLNELNYIRSKKWRNYGLIGENIKMKELKELIKYVAKTDATILITGETGSGKEIVAKEVYKNSNRIDYPYIKVNCAAIPDSLLESELFGYERGAFTGALNKEKLGMFELADKGTILLDEIGEMPLNLQSKLLRVLQEREIIRIGGSKSIKLDVRVISSTNQNLEKLTQQGKFREDLYYRLNVVPLRIPPLRERKDDIPILIHHFLEKYNIKYGKEKRIDNSAIIAMESYDWPGNVRELQNIIERIVVSDDENSITYDSVINVLGRAKVTIQLSDRPLTLKEAVEHLEKEMIEKALKKYGSTYKAAKALGTSQSTLFRKTKQLHIEWDKS
ncbi:sigma-54 interaction domain-containing protein [Wukongibacter sp. M2B1]|uniref:sigma-54 interaction domain-containing protein n=1 Tax=Wukongibacter sp. M2B1 TaxID=3088895 RepID=UPI003D79BA28